jgi:hypothetical protein
MEEKTPKKRGRKTISKDGAKMLNRNFRTTDAEWESCLLFGGGKWIRSQIHRKMRLDAQKKADEMCAPVLAETEK